MLASAVYAGVLDLDAARQATDQSGIRFGDALDAMGIVADMPIAGRPLAAYLELHIEQGPILEAEGVDIGIVTTGQGLRWYDVTITGFESHAGSTPMPRRRDALVAAAEWIRAIQAIGHRFGPHGVGTVGQLAVLPNSRNVIPGRVTFSVDLRHPDDDTLGRMDAEFRALAKDYLRAGFEIRIDDVDDSPPTRFDPGLLALLRDEATRLGLSHRDIISGAGHDAVHLAKVAPAAMIFTPCKDGISHNEAEEITRDWAKNGANLLLRAALRLAEAD
jgi:N-carbamoyl-L-amino-acid hydrolase